MVETLLARRALLLTFVLLTVPMGGCFGDGASDWAYRITGLRTLEGQGLKGTGIVIAIVDTGIDAGHDSLKGIHIKAWKDYVNNRPEPYDDQGHGSHVASIVAGKGASFGAKVEGYDLHGGAQKVSLVIVKAISKDSTGRTQDVIAGIDFAIQQDSDIICLSLGSHQQPLGLISDSMRDKVNQAISAGILVVAAAGNTGPNNDDVESPASVEGVIAVGAIDKDQKLAKFSARGNNAGVGPLGVGARGDPNKKPEIVAPGVEIKGAWKEDGYAQASGTSQAAPFVCSGLALVLEKHPDLRKINSGQLTSQVKEKIRSTAAPIPGQTTPHDARAGYGLFRADRLAAAFGA
jgi:serine protease AprX